MSKSVNEVHLVGRAGKDVEAKYTTTGKLVAKFSLATGGGKKKDGSGDWPTDWHNIEAWELPEAENVRKGAEVEVFGRIKYDSWEKNGQKHYMTKIVATKIVVDGAQHPSSDRHDFARPQTRTENQANAHGAFIDDSDVPF